jgi:hypothetical protein
MRFNDESLEEAIGRTEDKMREISSAQKALTGVADFIEDNLSSAIINSITVDSNCPGIATVEVILVSDKIDDQIQTVMNTHNWDNQSVTQRRDDKFRVRLKQKIRYE